MKRHLHSGFTLVELMISIILGLLITAAAIQLMTTSQRTVYAQQASSDLLDDGIFGMSSLATSIRMANFGAKPNTKGQSPFVMNDVTPFGGIVLSAASSNTDIADKNLPIYIDGGAAFVSKSNVTSTDESKRSLTNLNTTAPGAGVLQSDQLVLQRQAHEDMFDCQGNSVSAGDYIVERYRVSVDSLTQTNEPQALALFCSAAVYEGTERVLEDEDGNPLKDTEDNEISGYELKTGSLTGKGEVILNRVDHFHYLLGINTATNLPTKPAKNSVQFVSVADYMNDSKFAAPKPRIVAIKIGIVARSSNPTTAGPANSEQRFNVLDQENLKLKSDVASKSQYQRQVYETTITVRNARGAV